MKTNIRKKKIFGQTWWTYKEKCDKCGAVICKEEDLFSIKCPDENEVDFCAKCYRYFYDNNISYEEVCREIKNKQSTLA